MQKLFDIKNTSPQQKVQGRKSLKQLNRCLKKGLWKIQHVVLILITKILETITEDMLNVLWYLRLIKQHLLGNNVVGE